MFPVKGIDVPPDHVQTASAWHNGQASAFYSISSTGKIHSLKYLQDAIREIQWDLQSESVGWHERQDLLAFEDWLENLLEQFETNEE